MAGEWKETTLGAIAAKSGYGLVDGPFGSNLPASCYTETGIPVIRGSNLTTGVARFRGDEFVYVSQETAKENERSLCRPGDIVFTKKGTIGQTGFVPDGGKHCLYLVSSNQMKLTVELSVADPLFVYYFVSAPSSVEKIIRDSEATGVPKTNVAYLREFPISLPPLAEQKSIAAVLGALDDKIELNRRMNATLEAMARTLFQSWFVNFDPVRAKLGGRKPDGLDKPTAALFPSSFQDSPLGPIPQGWKLTTLREIAKVFSGGTPSKAMGGYWNGNIPWISPKVMTGIHVNDSEDHVSEGAVGNGTRLVPKGAVLVMVRGMGLHQGVRISQAQRDVTFNQDVKALVATTVPDTFLLYGLLQAAPMLLSKVHASGHGTGVLSTEFLDHLSFTVPPSDSLDVLAQPLAALNSKIATNGGESSTLATLRDTLLPKLLSGELRTQGGGT
jgi:type I restriction enzyme S subunit